MSTLAPGLCSVTMRHLAIEEVTQLAAAAGLRAIEWGGDVHVPPGDAQAVTRARVACEAAGVSCASYGSYLLADGDGSRATIARVLDTAAGLGAANVRVWTPFGVEPGSPQTGDVLAALGTVSEAAADRGLSVGLEFHGGTLTATASSTNAVLDAVGAPNLFTYWQPSYWCPDRPAGQDVDDVVELAPRLSHLHVYEWATAADRRPLSDGTPRWRSVLDAVVRSAPPARIVPRVAFLEFVAGDDPRALRRDAATLHELLAEVA